MVVKYTERTMTVDRSIQSTTSFSPTELFLNNMKKKKTHATVRAYQPYGFYTHYCLFGGHVTNLIYTVDNS